MNRKTTITGLAIILIALLTLSGCDAILEAFYPELTERGGEGNNAIGLWVEISVPGGEVNDPQIAAVVEDAWSGEIVSEAFVWPSWNWDNQGNLILSAYIELYDIPGSSDEYREFRVFTWLERYGNDYPEWDEPQTNAFWHPYPDDSNWKEDIFWFPNDYGSWIEASAFVGFGAEPMNYQFVAAGPLVIDVTAQGTSKLYDLFPEDPNLNISEFSWDLYNQYYDHVDGQWQWVEDVPSASFNVDYSTLSTGDYWLEIGVGYVDGQYRWKRYPVRILTEANFGASYDLTVSIWSTQYDPMYLMDGTSYDARIRVIDTDEFGNTWFDRDYVTTVTPSAGQITHTIGGLSYDPSAEADGDPVDWVEIVIDTTMDFEFGPGDWKLSMPIGLSADEALYYERTMEFEAWDMRPVFTAE